MVLLGSIESGDYIRKIVNYVYNYCTLHHHKRKQWTDIIVQQLLIIPSGKKLCDSLEMKITKTLYIYNAQTIHYQDAMLHQVRI